MSNAAHFRQLTQAILIGQPIGEVPNSYQEAAEFVLPQSGWVVRHSVRYYQFAPGGKNLIDPDKYVPETWADVKAGKDPTLDWVMAQALDSSAFPRRIFTPGTQASEQAVCRGLL